MSAINFENTLQFPSRIENEIRLFIYENFFWDDGNILADEDSLLAGGVIDSTGVLEIVAFIEKKYGIKVEDEELIPDNLDSIKNISRYIAGKLK